MTYTLFSTIDTGIVLLSGNGVVRQLWIVGAKGVAKPHSCANCKQTIGRGEKAYHPMTNGKNRGDRLHPACVA
jgi:hypothetical protein